MKYSFNKIILLSLIIISILTLTGCPESTNPSNNNNNINFEEGITITYQIPATKNYLINDSVSKLTFTFPDGLPGVLKITKIKTGYQIDSDENAFKYEFEGDGKVIALFKNQADYYYELKGFLDLKSTIIDFYEESQNQGWTPIPELKIEGNNCYYDLSSIPNIAFDSKKDIPQGTTLKRTFIFNSANYPKSSTKGRTKADFEKVLGDIIPELMKNLSSTLKPTVDAKLKGSHKYYVSLLYDWQDNIGTVARYVDFWDHTLLTPRCAFVLSAKYTTPKITVHETGHYFHHLLVGDNKFYQFANKTSGFGHSHSVGKARSRTDIIEDFALIAEYLFSNIVSTKDIETGKFLREYYDNKSGKLIINSPLAVDFPSIEGMTAAMFASLLRTKPDFTDWNDRKIKVPLVTGVTFADIFDIEAKGINDVVGNVNEVEALLKKKGNQESKLPILLNAYGWNYDFLCTLVTTSGKPIKNASIKCVSKYDPSKYYLVKGGLPSKDDGTVGMTNCYPGASILRVYLESGDSIDVDINIDWNRLTNKTYDYGKVTVKTTGNTISINQSIDNLLHFTGNPIEVKLTCFMNQPDVYLSKSGVDYDGSISGYPAYVINAHIANMPTGSMTQSDSVYVSVKPPNKLESEFSLTSVSYPNAKHEKYMFKGFLVSGTIYKTPYSFMLNKVMRANTGWNSKETVVVAVIEQVLYDANYIELARKSVSVAIKLYLKE